MYSVKYDGPFAGKMNYSAADRWAVGSGMWIFIKLDWFITTSYWWQTVDVLRLIFVKSVTSFVESDSLFKVFYFIC